MVAAVYGVPWIPSIYPSHVSINIPYMDPMGFHGCWVLEPWPNGSPNSSPHRDTPLRLGLGCRWCNPFRALDLGDQVEIICWDFDGGNPGKMEDFTLDFSKK